MVVFKSLIAIGFVIPGISQSYSTKYNKSSVSVALKKEKIVFKLETAVVVLLMTTLFITVWLLLTKSYVKLYFTILY